MSDRKRKQLKDTSATRFSDDQPHSSSGAFTVSERDTSPGPGLYVQMYEADIIRGPAAAISAASLEAPSSTEAHKMGGALIKWGGQPQPAFPQDEDVLGVQVNVSDNCIWVDRYDARLLLDTLPSFPPSEAKHDVPDSPGGWSDLPSDNEDVFFLSPEEVDDFRRDKKRRHIEHAREERLKARRAEDGESSAEDEDVWGGSDEEPDDTQRDLMQRTATHLMSSPNPTQLEARILANHGSDPRFAFLRGRWSNTWNITKGKARIAKEKERVKEKGATISLLAGYGDSDEDGDDAAQAADEEEVEPQPTILKMEPTSTAAVNDVDATMESRRARAKEWVEKRRKASKEK